MSPFEFMIEGNGWAGGFKVEGRKVCLKYF